MSDLFSIYEDSFNILIHSVNKIIDDIDNLSKEKSEQALSEANNNLKEAESHLKKMDLECESNFGKNSERLKLKVNNYKNEYKNIKNKFLKQQEIYIGKKSKEMIGKSDFKNNNKEKLIIDTEDNDEEAYNQSNKLDYGKRKMLEIEHDTKNIGKELNSHTDKIRKTDARIVNMGESLDDSDNLVTKMIKRERRNKLLIYGLIVFFCILFIIIVISKFGGNSDKPAYNTEDNKDNTDNINLKLNDNSISNSEFLNKDIITSELKENNNTNNNDKSNEVKVEVSTSIKEDTEN